MAQRAASCVEMWEGALCLVEGRRFGVRGDWAGARVDIQGWLPYMEGGSASLAASPVSFQPSPMRPLSASPAALDHREQSPAPDALLFILPLLIVLSTFLFVLLLFLVCIIFIRRRRGIVLRDADGPLDMSREELYEADGGFEGVESRWLESVSDPVRASYLRAKGPSLRPCHPHQIDPLCLQLINYSIPLTRNQLISPYRNFYPYRKKASPLGASSPTTKPSIRFSFTPALKSPSSPILHPLHVSNQIYLFQN